MKYFLVFAVGFLLVFACSSEVENAASVSSDDGLFVKDSTHPSGLIYAEGFPLVRGNCTTCHSAKLITQNRATRAGWETMIRWMQETQGLHDLGEHEDVILDYLALHYAPVETGRRANLDPEAIEWYILHE